MMVIDARKKNANKLNFKFYYRKMVASGISATLSDREPKTC